MKNRSRSLTRSRRRQAFVVLSADNTLSPVPLYVSPRRACAIANSGSSSTARRTKTVAAALPEESSVLLPVLYAFRAASDDVVTSGRVEFFSTVVCDSPAQVLKRRAI